MPSPCNAARQPDLVLLLSNTHPETQERISSNVPDHYWLWTVLVKRKKYAYTLEQHINNPGMLMLHLNLRRKITLVLHDWGGAIGMGTRRASENHQKFCDFLIPQPFLCLDSLSHSNVSDSLVR
jgi:hypothetical protein